MIDIDEDNLKNGVLGLVIALIEIIRDALRLQATRRIDSGNLTDEEVERLGTALSELDATIDEIKVEHGVNEAVKNVRDGLDNIANNIINQLINPEEWAKRESKENQKGEING